jgi:hypothetical protein
MQPKTSAFALLCLALAGAAHAGPDTTGALPVPANRVLGLWEASGTVTPCNGGPGPVVQVANTTVFQSGGTLVENPRTPTIARSIGLGTWSYDASGDSYRQHLEFYRFNSDGSFAGHATVDRRFVLSADGQATLGPVEVAFYAANGGQLFVLCGEVAGTRR